MHRSVSTEVLLSGLDDIGPREGERRVLLRADGATGGSVKLPLPKSEADAAGFDPSRPKRQRQRLRVTIEPIIEETASLEGAPETAALRTGRPLGGRDEPAGRLHRTT